MPERKTQRKRNQAKRESESPGKYRTKGELAVKIRFLQGGTVHYQKMVTCGVLRGALKLAILRKITPPYPPTAGAATSILWYVLPSGTGRLANFGNLRPGTLEQLVLFQRN